MSTISVDSILRSIARLKPMPSNVSAILREIERQDTSIDKLTVMVELDQALTALVLQMSNSASLGYARTCSTVHEAIMHIGLKRFKTILTTSSATAMMSQSVKGYRLGAGELWHHALTVAVAAEWLAQIFHYPDPEQAYVAGLLHDIGKLLMDQAILSNYASIADYISKYQMPLSQVEEKLIGIDHGKVGGLIAEHWSFPVVLADAIRFHHAPSLARTSPKLPAIVNLANSFAEDYQLNKSALLSFNIHPESLNIFNLTPPMLTKIKADMQNSGIFPNLAKAGTS